VGSLIHTDHTALTQFLPPHQQPTITPAPSEYSTALINAAEYVLLLVGLLVLFSVVALAVRQSKLTLSLSDSTMRLMSAGYGFVYAILAGLLIYFGIENLNSFIRYFTNHTGLVNLVSVSTVAMFCLLYAALFHNIVSALAGRRLKINPFSNVASYVLARVLLISGIFALTIAGTTAVTHGRL
jgi:hypothetical protein